MDLVERLLSSVVRSDEILGKTGSLNQRVMRRGIASSSGYHGYNEITSKVV